MIVIEYVIDKCIEKGGTGTEFLMWDELRWMFSAINNSKIFWLWNWSDHKSLRNTLTCDWHGE